MNDSMKPSKKKPVGLTATARTGESDQQAIARTLLSPSVHAGHMLAEAHKRHPAVDINALVAELESQANAVSAGTFKRSEEMLIAQAHVLNELFYEFVRRGRANAREGYLQATEIYTKLGMRAQSQCRASLETLATIKNPPVVFAKQANVTTGPQQVNNGVAVPNQPSRAGETEIPPNKLLETQHVERLDARTQSAASAVNQKLETLGAIDGASDRGGENAR